MAYIFLTSVGPTGSLRKPRSANGEARWLLQYLTFFFFWFMGEIFLKAH